MHFNLHVTFVTAERPEDDAMRHRNMYEFLKRQLSIEYIVRLFFMYCKKSEIWLLYTIDTSHRNMVILHHRHVPQKNILSVFHGFVLQPAYRTYRL